MRNDSDKKASLILALCGIVPVVWFALLTAPYVSGGLVEIVRNLPQAMNTPFSITVCADSLKTVLIFLLAYGMGIGIYLFTRRNYRRREEHGSAKWGDAGAINKKYRDKDPTENKLLTQNVRIGLDGKKHRRNLNILVCGGSGAGKTRFFCKPNAMQCNTSFVVLDPKGEIVRDIGGLLEKKGYEVRVLDLINMHRSHCYNPFVYLRNDNDVQRLVTNLFKATTPKGSQSQDPFWDTAASMLLLSLVFYLKYEAPPEEQNFPMVMELLRAGEVREDDDSYVSPLDELFDRLEMVNPEHIALKYYRDYHSGSAKTLKSIQITLAATVRYTGFALNVEAENFLKTLPENTTLKAKFQVINGVGPTDILAVVTPATEYAEGSSTNTLFPQSNVLQCLIDKDTDVKIGQNATVVITAGTKENILLLPLSVIAGRQGKGMVTVIKDGEQIQTEVTLGATDGAYIEILSGVEEGDVVSSVPPNLDPRSNS